jgi:hypothetical protein
MMCFFLAALRLYQRWPILGGIALALSIGVKFLPVLALPWMLTALKRRAAVMLAVATAVTTAVIFAVSYDPWMFSALNTYTAVWSANSVWPMVFAPFVATPRHVRVVLGIVLLVLLIVVWRRYQGNAIIGMQLTLMSVYIMSPVLHPWYVIPAIALTAMRPMRSTIVLATMMSLYGIIVDGQQKSGMWFEHPALLVVEIVPVIVAYLIDMRRPPSLLDEGAMQHTVPA